MKDKCGNQYDDSLEAMIERAKKGDTRAAKDALLIIAISLQTNKVPLPDYARKYLSEALYKISSNGNVDANIALNLKTAHAPKKHAFIHLRKAAILMKAMLMVEAATDSGKKMTKKEAAKEAARIINEKHKDAKLTMSSVVNFYDERSSDIDKETKDYNRRRITTLELTAPNNPPTLPDLKLNNFA